MKIISIIILLLLLPSCSNKDTFFMTSERIAEFEKKCLELFPDSVHSRVTPKEMYLADVSGDGNVELISYYYDPYASSRELGNIEIYNFENKKTTALFTSVNNPFKKYKNGEETFFVHEYQKFKENNKAINFIGKLCAENGEIKYEELFIYEEISDESGGLVDTYYYFVSDEISEAPLEGSVGFFCVSDPRGLKKITQSEYDGMINMFYKNLEEIPYKIFILELSKQTVIHEGNETYAFDSGDLVNQLYEFSFSE